MNLTRLTYCQVNYESTIAEIALGLGSNNNLKLFDLKIGDKIFIKSKENGHGKVTVEHNNKVVKLGHELASKILLECTEEPIITLDQLKIGDLAEVIKMGAKGDVRFRLLDMGLVKGVKVKIIRVAPLGDPIEILINSFNLSLRKEEAKGIFVKIIQIDKSQKKNKKHWGIF